MLALKIKRNILLELNEGCPSLIDNPEKQTDILNEYKRYLEQVIITHHRNFFLSCIFNIFF